MRIKNLVIFGAGILIGSAITYKLITDKYENLIEDEIESVKESLGYYNRSNDKSELEVKEEDDNKDPKVYDPLKTEKKDYEHMIAYHKYHTESDEKEGEEDDEEYDDEYVDPAEKEHPGIEYHQIEKAPEHSFRGNIYIIPPQEYGIITDYDLIDLTYYNDGVLCDDMDEIVEDIDEKVGRDYVNHFGDYDEDVIHVRNDILKCDYEITRDIRDYADVAWIRPPHYEV